MNRANLKIGKETVANLLRKCELLDLENQAIKVLLEAVGNRPAVHGWGKRLVALMNDPALRAKVHAAYASFYSQIQDAADEGAVLDILQKIPAATLPAS